MPAESSSKSKEKDSTKSSKEKEKEAATEETEDESTIAANKAAVAAQTKAATMAAALAAAAAASASGGQQVTTEKPAHYTYLKGFRVDQCALFLQHKCTQHRPYTCFYWHFKNQRRRRPVRKRDGTFNYNPDVYCDKVSISPLRGRCPAGQRGVNPKLRPLTANPTTDKNDALAPDHAPRQAPARHRALHLGSPSQAQPPPATHNPLPDEP